MGGPGLWVVCLGEVAFAAGWVGVPGLEGVAFQWGGVWAPI